MKKIFIYSLFILFLFSFREAQSQYVSTIAGSTYGYTNGPAAIAQFDTPTGICADTFGNLIIADRYNHQIRKITPLGMVSRLAGTDAGMLDGIDTVAKFNNPVSVCCDKFNNIYVADYLNHKIRKISPVGIVSTLAGSTEGYADGMGAAAQFAFPTSVCTDDTGNVYVTDLSNAKIRKITPAGLVTTFAGSTAGNADGIGLLAQFSSPQGICADSFNNLYVADYGNHRIRKITPGALVTTFAGDLAGWWDGIGTMAAFSGPLGVCSDASNNIYVAEQGNHRIRKITPAAMVSTLAGDYAGFADGYGMLALFNIPSGVYADTAYNVFVADAINHKIRKITPSFPLSTPISQFEVKMNYNDHSLFWTTNYEKNNSYFNVQMSEDGIQFSNLCLVKSKALYGNCTIPIDYNFTNQNPPPGICYYRLEQVDLDGNTAFSKVITIDFIKSDEANIVLFPIPCSNTLYVLVNSKMSIRIVDIYGRIIVNRNFRKGSNFVDLSSHASGIYLLRAGDGEYYKFTKQ